MLQDREPRAAMMMIVSKEYALTTLLEDLAAEGDVAERVEVVADYLNHQHQNHQALQVIRQQEGHRQRASDGSEVEQSQHPSGLLEHVLDLRDGRGEEAGAT